MLIGEIQSAQLILHLLGVGDWVGSEWGCMLPLPSWAETVLIFILMAENSKTAIYLCTLIGGQFWTAVKY